MLDLKSIKSLIFFLLNFKIVFSKLIISIKIFFLINQGYKKIIMSSLLIFW